MAGGSHGGTSPEREASFLIEPSYTYAPSFQSIVAVHEGAMAHCSLFYGVCEGNLYNMTPGHHVQACASSIPSNDWTDNPS